MTSEHSVHAHGQVSDLITELAAGGSAELDVKLDDGVVPRLLAYSRSVAGFPTAVKEVSRWHAAWPPVSAEHIHATGQVQAGYSLTSPADGAV